MIYTRDSRSDFERFMSTLSTKKFVIGHEKMRAIISHQLNEFERVQLIAPRQAGLTTFLVMYALFRASQAPLKIQIVAPNMIMVSYLKDIILSFNGRGDVWRQTSNRLFLGNGSVISLLSSTQFLSSCQVADLTIFEHLSSLSNIDQTRAISELNARSRRFILAGQPSCRYDEFAALWAEAQQQKNLIHTIRITPQEIFDDGSLRYYKSILGEAAYRIEFDGQFVT